MKYPYLRNTHAESRAAIAAAPGVVGVCDGSTVGVWLVLVMNRDQDGTEALTLETWGIGGRLEDEPVMPIDSGILAPLAAMLDVASKNPVVIKVAGDDHFDH